MQRPLSRRRRAHDTQKRQAEQSGFLPTRAGVDLALELNSCWRLPGNCLRRWRAQLDAALHRGVAAQLASGVKTIVGNKNALAALKVDGSVVTWGTEDCGGDSSDVAAQLSGGVKSVLA